MGRALEGRLKPPPPPPKRRQGRPSLKVNFLGAYEWWYREEKIITTKINKITEARRQAEDPDYERSLKKRLQVVYKEFKDIFFKK